MKTKYSEHTDWQMMGLIGSREKLSDYDREELDREIERRKYTPEDVAHMEKEANRINSRMASLRRTFPHICLIMSFLFIILALIPPLAKSMDMFSRIGLVLLALVLFLFYVLLRRNQYLENTSDNENS